MNARNVIRVLFDTENGLGVTDQRKRRKPLIYRVNNISKKSFRKTFDRLKILTFVLGFILVVCRKAHHCNVSDEPDPH